MIKKTKDKEGSSILEFRGQTVVLERKKIKNLYLRVRPPEGRLCVSAPYRMPVEAIYEFLLSKQEWIRQQQEKLNNRQEAMPSKKLQYLNDEEVFLWGRSLPLKVQYNQRKNGAILRDSDILLQVKKGEGESKAEERYGILKQLFRQELELIVPELLLKWEEIIGVKAKEWYLRDMTSRWGTCQVLQKKICLNLKLAGKAPECLEYVIVHELVHLLESSHNHIFRSYMDLYLPDWKHIRARLNGRVPDEDRGSVS